MVFFIIKVSVQGRCLQMQMPILGEPNFILKIQRFAEKSGLLHTDLRLFEDILLILDDSQKFTQ